MICLLKLRPLLFSQTSHKLFIHSPVQLSWWLLLKSILWVERIKYLTLHMLMTSLYHASLLTEQRNNFYLHTVSLIGLEVIKTTTSNYLWDLCLCSCFTWALSNVDVNLANDISSQSKNDNDLIPNCIIKTYLINHMLNLCRNLRCRTGTFRSLYIVVVLLDNSVLS